MARNIPLQELEIEIVRELSEFGSEVAEAIKREAKSAANKSVEKLKKTSPKDTGEYAKGWKFKIEYESTNDIRIRIYNSKKPELTHLLENGHAKKGGGRVAAIPHIRPAEQEAEKALQNGVKVVVRG